MNVHMHACVLRYMATPYNIGWRIQRTYREHISAYIYIMTTYVHALHALIRALLMHMISHQSHLHTASR